MLTEPLIERNPTTGELEPKLATEWTSDDDTKWTLKLREGVMFHHGREFEAKDGVYTLERLLKNLRGRQPEMNFNNIDVISKISGEALQQFLAQRESDNS